MDQPKNNQGAVAADQMAEESYTGRRNGARAMMDGARGIAMATDRRPWLERALVPALLGGIFAVSGSFAIHVSVQIQELRAEMGNVRGDVGELKGRLDGVDRRLDGVDRRINDLRTDMNDRLGRIEALLMSRRPAASDPGP